ncbi:GTP cyclohydrolase II [Ectopseudomonas mendocina]|uniref:hypothetical protein n=1 Tax=Ectopseudomonas mendocina TaxID=300 RepID=UPI0034D96451
MYGFKATYTDEEIVVLTKGAIRQHENVRLHSACLTGDIFHSQRCDCGAQLESSMKRAGARNAYRQACKRGDAGY